MTGVKTAVKGRGWDRLGGLLDGGSLARRDSIYTAVSTVSRGAQGCLSTECCRPIQAPARLRTQCRTVETSVLEDENAQTYRNRQERCYD
jgi:hypothetical protein